MVDVVVTILGAILAEMSYFLEWLACQSVVVVSAMAVLSSSD